MPVGWFLAPYKRDADGGVGRYCAMDDFTTAIRLDGGDWAESEVLGDHAVVKVRANVPTLQAINAAPGFTRLPKDRLDDPLSDLTAAQKTALRNRLTGLGYTLAELQAALGPDLGQRTLRDVLVFAATRRRKPRYDAATDTIVLDGAVQACRPIRFVDEAVA